MDVIEIDAASNRGIDEIRESAGDGAVPPHGGPVQGLHHRRSAHAHRASLQRPFENPGRAPGPQYLHPRHNGVPEDPLHHHVPLPAVRFQEDLGIAAHHRAVGRHLPSKEIEYDEKVLNYMVREADGSMRDAESILDQVISYSGTQVSEKT